MAKSFLELSRAADDTTPEHVKLGDEECIQITLRDKTKKLQTLTGHAWHVFPYATPVKIDAIEGDELTKFQRFQRLLRTALLEPLYRFDRATRQGPNVYALIMPLGETWRLELAEVKAPDGKTLLLPLELSGPPGKVTFEEYRFNNVTNLPKKVLLGEFGARWFYLRLSGVTYEANVFADPTEAKAGRQVIVQSSGFQPDPPVGEVGLKTVAAKTALLLDDPGDWNARFQMLLQHGKELVAQGQTMADIDFMFDQDGKRHLAMPFEQAPDDLGGKPFVKKTHQRLLQLPAQQVAIVYPKNGPLAQSEKTAKILLDAYLAKHKLKPIGPLRISPWIQLENRLPTERELNHLRIGFEVPIASVQKR